MKKLQCLNQIFKEQMHLAIELLNEIQLRWQLQENNHLNFTSDSPIRDPEVN